jgi:hypothetical protein
MNLHLLDPKLIVLAVVVILIIAGLAWLYARKRRSATAEMRQRFGPDDVERDFIGASLTKTLAVSRQEYLHCVTPVFRAQTASGEAYYSDGRILLLDLQRGDPNNNRMAAQSSILVRATSIPSTAPAESFQSNLTSPR